VFAAPKSEAELCHAAVVQVPNVSRQEFNVIDIADDGFVSLPACHRLALQICQWRVHRRHSGAGRWDASAHSRYMTMRATWHVHRHNFDRI